MSCQARGAFWLRHWSSGCWDMTICCILHDLSIEQTSRAFATEITPLAQIWHSHPFLVYCCGPGTCSDAFLALYFVRNCHFSSWDFHPKYATPRTIVFAMPIIEYCHVKYQHFFIHYPMTQGCSGLYWSLLKQLHFSQFQCRKLKECTKMSVIDLILY